jgi:hypothetical protein
MHAERSESGKSKVQSGPTRIMTMICTVMDYCTTLIELNKLPDTIVFQVCVHACGILIGPLFATIFEYCRCNITPVIRRRFEYAPLVLFIQHAFLSIQMSALSISPFFADQSIHALMLSALQLSRAVCAAVLRDKHTVMLCACMYSWIRCSSYESASLHRFMHHSSIFHHATHCTGVFRVTHMPICHI